MSYLTRDKKCESTECLAVGEAEPKSVYLFSSKPEAVRYDCGCTVWSADANGKNPIVLAIPEDALEVIPRALLPDPGTLRKWEGGMEPGVHRAAFAIQYTVNEGYFELRRDHIMQALQMFPQVGTVIARELPMSDDEIWDAMRDRR